MARRLLRTGLGMCVAGVVLTALAFFAPWRTCVDDTAAAGCPGGVEGTASVIGVALLAFGIVLCAVSLIGYARGR